MKHRTEQRLEAMVEKEKAKRLARFAKLVAEVKAYNPVSEYGK